MDRTQVLHIGWHVVVDTETGWKPGTVEKISAPYVAEGFPGKLRVVGVRLAEGKFLEVLSTRVGPA